MRPTMRTAGGGKKTISREQFDRVKNAIVKPSGPGAIRTPALPVARPAVSADPMGRRHTDGGQKLSDADPGLNARLMPTGAARTARPDTADDMRRRAAAAKARIAPLLKEADEILEQARLHYAEKSTQEGRAAIARRLKAKHL